MKDNEKSLKGKLSRAILGAALIFGLILGILDILNVIPPQYCLFEEESGSLLRTSLLKLTGWALATSLVACLFAAMLQKLKII